MGKRHSATDLPDMHASAPPRSARGDVLRACGRGDLFFLIGLFLFLFRNGDWGRKGI